MPLYAPILINETTIETIKISRLRSLRAKDAEYPYIIRVLSTGQEATFTHRYSDGALTCLRKGLEALEAAIVSESEVRSADPVPGSGVGDNRPADQQG